MRELHGWHGRDGGDDGDSQPDEPHKRAREVPPPRYEVVHDAAARRAYALEYRELSEAKDAAYRGRHARPPEAQNAGDRLHHVDRADQSAPRIADRDVDSHREAERNRKPERSWLPSDKASQFIVSVDSLFTAVNAAYHIVPGKMDVIAAAAVGVVVSGIAWANERWKDKHGHRPED